MHVCPAAQPGITKVGSHTTLPDAVHDARQETVGRPLLVSSQHCAAWPRDAVHCAESLQDAKIFGGAQDWLAA